MNGGHILILGGARSGKSRLGEQICQKLSDNCAYIATAQAGDAEMRQRIKKHQQQRGGIFTTFEEPLDLTGTILTAAKSHDMILVDCLTLWLANLEFSETVSKPKSIEALLATLNQLKNQRIVLVSNEVGTGIVPDNALARTFRDDAGMLHQQVAAVCDHVYMVIAGLPMVLKGELVQTL